MPPPQTEDSHEPDEKTFSSTRTCDPGLRGRPTGARWWWTRTRARPRGGGNRHWRAILGLGMGLRISVLSRLLLSARLLRISGIRSCAADNVHPAGSAAGLRRPTCSLLGLLRGREGVLPVREGMPGRLAARYPATRTLMNRALSALTVLGAA